jgi:hypothetical protein
MSKKIKKKVKLSRYTPWKRQGWEEVWLLLILNLGTRWGWVVSITPRPRFTPGERTPGTHWTGGWVGPRASLDAEARRKILCLCRGSNPGRTFRSQTLYWLIYPLGNQNIRGGEGPKLDYKKAIKEEEVVAADSNLKQMKLMFLPNIPLNKPVLQNPVTSHRRVLNEKKQVPGRTSIQCSYPYREANRNICLIIIHFNNRSYVRSMWHVTWQCFTKNH